MNIDTTKIENFDEMDAESLRNFIKDFSYDDHSEDFAKAKKRNDELSKENADYKRKLNASKDEGEKSKTESEERFNDLNEKYNELVRNSTIDKLAMRYQRQGYTDELAQETARAYYDRDDETVFKNQEIFRVAFEKKIREDVIKNTPKPDVNGKKRSGEITKEEFSNMGYTERMELYTENRELYDKLNEG